MSDAFQVLSPVSEMHSIFSNRNLPSTSEPLERVITVAYSVWGFH